jgi:hypothetical protein
VLQVLVAGVIALGSKWLLDGGIRRRDRQVIREELELAALLDHDSVEAIVLRASAHVRLKRYLRPSFWKRAAPLATRALNIAVIVAVLLVGGAAVVAAKDSISGGFQGYASAGAIGVTVAIMLEAIQQTLRRVLHPPDPTRNITDEQFAEAGMTREQFKESLAEHRARSAQVRKRR